MSNKDSLFLVAPTKAIQKLWRKQFPGVKVYLSKKLSTTRH